MQQIYGAFLNLFILEISLSADAEKHLSSLMIKIFTNYLAIAPIISEVAVSLYFRPTAPL